MSYVGELWRSSQLDHLCDLGGQVVLGQVLEAVVVKLFRVNLLVEFDIGWGVEVTSVVAMPHIVASSYQLHSDGY